MRGQPGLHALCVALQRRTRSIFSCMACPLYDELRGTMVSSILAGLRALPKQNYHLLRRWERGTQAQRFNVIMGLQTKDEVRALALYLEKAWDLRASSYTGPGGAQQHR